MKIMVTGASGFIGGAFMRRFADTDGVSLCGVGRRAHVELPASVEYYALGLDQLHTLDVVPDVVIHAAGRTSPGVVSTIITGITLRRPGMLSIFAVIVAFHDSYLFQARRFITVLSTSQDCVNVMLSAPNLAANMGAQNVRQSALLRRIRVRNHFSPLCRIW